MSFYKIIANLISSLIITMLFSIVAIKVGNSQIEYSSILFILTFFIITNVQYLAAIDLASLLFKKKSKIIFIISHLCLLFYFLTDLLSYFLFKIHIKLTYFTELKQAILLGEIPIKFQLITSILVGLAGFILTFYFSMRFLEIVVKKIKLQKISRKLLYLTHLIPLIVLLILIKQLPTHAVHLIPTQNTFSRYKIKEFKFFKKIFEKPLIVDYSKEKINLLRIEKKLKTLLKTDQIKSNIKPDLLFIHIEGFRSDMLTKEITPNLYSYGQNDGTVLKTHYSNGNGTRSGMAGILTGLSPFYFPIIREIGHKPMSLRILGKLGYEKSIYLSQSLRWNSTDKDLLNGQINFIGSDKLKMLDREEDVINKYLESLNQNNLSPRFDYLIFYSSHYDYYFREQFTKFKPILTKDFKLENNLSFVHTAKYLKNALLNRYKNSLVYIDHWLNKVILKLKKTKRLENTIIVIFGDHGEEFWEKGRFSHSNGLNNEQIKTAMVIIAPKKLITDYSITSHMDIFPTIFNYIGLNTNISDLMIGKNLLEFNPEDDFTLSYKTIMPINRRQNTFVAIGDDLKVTFKYLEGHPIEILNITDLNDSVIKNSNKAQVKALLLKALSLKSNSNL